MRLILTVLGYVCCFAGVVLGGSELGSFEDFTVIEKHKEGLLSLVENDKAASPVSSKPLTVPLTLIQGAASKGAGISLSFSLLCVCSNLYIVFTQRQLLTLFPLFIVHTHDF